MAKFSEMFVSWMLLGLLMVSMFGFVSVSQNDTDLNETSKAISNPIFNDTYNSLSGSLVDSRDQSQTQKDLFDSEDPKAGFGSLLLLSIVSGGKIFGGYIITIYNALLVLPLTYLGIPAVVASTLSTVLLVLIILGLWAVFRGG